MSVMLETSCGNQHAYELSKLLQTLPPGPLFEAVLWALEEAQDEDSTAADLGDALCEVLGSVKESLRHLCHEQDPCECGGFLICAATEAIDALDKRVYREEYCAKLRKEIAGYEQLVDALEGCTIAEPEKEEAAP